MKDETMKPLFAAALTAIIAGGLFIPTVEAGVLSSAARGALAKRAMRSPPSVAAPRLPALAATKPKDVIIHRSRHPGAAAHIEHAQRGGQPTILHVDRKAAAGNRAAAIGSVRRDRKPAPRFERDEYPPAFTREGGHNANVRFINRHDNRGAGSSMGAQTRGLPEGSRIRVLVTD